MRIYSIAIVLSLVVASNTVDAQEPRAAATTRIAGDTLRARLTDMTTSMSISVSATDSANILGGSFFGYFNNVRVKDGGTVALNGDFDNFSVRRRSP